MQRPRFSIASLLVVIGILGVALAALRNPSYLWANVTFSLAFASLVVAIVNAVYGRSARRAYWLGFTVCGGAYFAVCSLPGLCQEVCPRLATEVIFDLLYPYMAPTVPPPPPVPPPSMTMGQMMNQMMGQARGGIALRGMAMSAPPVPASSWSAWNEPDRSNGVGYQIGTVSLVSSEAFRQIGHSLATLLAGVLGGVYARSRHKVWAARDMPQEPQGQALS
jgi:hypothetical protein